MSSQARDIYAEAAAIVARIPRARAAREMAAELDMQVAAFERLSPEAHADVLSGIERNLRRWWRFMSTGVMPPSSDFEPLREWARARAADGVGLEDLLCSFGLTHQLGWQLLRRHAREDESEVLVELAGLVAQYSDRISAVVTEAYLAERALFASEEERRARSLLDRLCADVALEVSDLELADHLGVPVDCRYTPFAIVIPGRSARRRSILAARLRREGWRLAVTESDCVVGVTWAPLDISDLGEGGEVLLAIGQPTPRDELAVAREDVAVLVEHGRRTGLRGRLETDEHLLEILVGRSPRLAARLRERVLAPLAADDHGELARTLQTLVACRFDRTATSATLHIHRNTLAYRLGRIEEITGLDLGSPRDLARTYMATAIGAVPSRR